MPLLRTLTLVLLAACVPALAPAQPRFHFDRTPGLLPKAVQAPHQALTLDLDPERDHFDGESTLTLSLRQPQPDLLLHAHQLTARRSVLLSARGERPLTVVADEKTQTWRLVPVDGRPLPAGRVTLRLAWTGRVQDNGSGLYRAPFRAQGVEQRMLATQLQAIYARTVFPAFDEPAFRTRFELSVRAPAGYEVLSNMPAVATQAVGDRVVHRFAATPPMPAYLVAVTVGRFDTLAGRAAGVPLRIVTAPGKREQGRYALAATQRLLPYYTAYFGQPYALPRLDQLAVPSSRDGAMEDWGLISYTESALLFDPATGNTGHQRGIFNIVAHEVAHQWFGNLVTAASWEEIWLNEAFATWMADKASEHFNPQWQLGLRRRSDIDQAMERDGGPATRAIRSGAVLEDRVFDVFDDITYAKGGAVLGMLEAWIGPDRFRRGLAAYMKERRMSNATAGDLWFHIGRASGRDVAAVASPAGPTSPASRWSTSTAAATAAAPGSTWRSGPSAVAARRAAGAGRSRWCWTTAAARSACCCSTTGRRSRCQAARPHRWWSTHRGWVSTAWPTRRRCSRR
jgi:aminopeptidase N